MVYTVGRCAVRHSAAMIGTDQRISAIERAFLTALRRMCAALSEEEAEDEFSNMLHHTYRVSERCRKLLGEGSPRFIGTTLAPIEGAQAVLWARKLDTHDSLLTSELGDVFSDYFTEMFGVLVWKPLAPEAGEGDPYARRPEYEHDLQGKPVLDTMAHVFRGIKDLAPQRRV